jgi:hypothetical protein
MYSIEISFRKNRENGSFSVSPILGLQGQVSPGGYLAGQGTPLRGGTGPILPHTRPKFVRSGPESPKYPL